MSDGAPQPETADQRRERLARAAYHARFEEDDSYPVATAYTIADAIISSDRAAGCDPEALRAEIEAWKASDNAKLDRIARHQRERDEALAERDELAARLAVVTEALEDAKASLESARDAIRRRMGSTNPAREDALAKASTALTDLPSRAAALLRVVEAAREWRAEMALSKNGGIKGAGLIWAIDALDGTTGHG